MRCWRLPRQHRRTFQFHICAAKDSCREHIAVGHVRGKAERRVGSRPSIWLFCSRQIGV